VAESFDGERLLRVHPGPVSIACGPSVVVIRAVEIYPAGTIVTWTCSPAAGEVARLAHGMPRVTLRLRDDAATGYISLGESLQGGGRTIFGASFFGAAPAATSTLMVAAEVTGAAGGAIAMTGEAAFPLAP
jgi:hypothetical protein